MERPFVVELIQRRPEVLNPTGAQEAPVDITDRVLLDGFGTINRAVERNLLSFTTGDVTILLDNTDGYFDQVFKFFSSTDEWMMRIYRGGLLQFLGIVISKGSIRFDRKAKNVEITAYGPTKVLDETSAELVTRTFSAMSLNANAGAGATSLTLNTTAGLLSGDVLRITDHINAEEVTVKQVTSSTVVSLDAATVHAFVIGNPVTNTTPFHRFKGIDFLVQSLFEAAKVPLQEYITLGTQFKKAAPTPVSINLIDLSTYGYAAPVEVSGTCKFTVGPTTPTIKTYSQASPESDWINEDTLAAYLDWSRYFPDDGTQPAEYLRHTLRVEADPTGGSVPHAMALDVRSSPRRLWAIRRSSNPNVLIRYDWSGGPLWTGPTNVSNLPTGATDTNLSDPYGVEHDYVRDQLYVFWESAGTYFSYIYDIAGGTWTNLMSGADGSNRYFGFCYVYELDAVVALYGTSPTASTLQIACLRNGQRLWLRPFPTVIAGAEAVTPYYFATQTLRFVNGGLYCVGLADGALQFISSLDEFQTYQMSPVQEQGNKRLLASRVLGQYRIVTYSGSVQRVHLIAAPFYAGVVNYADYTGKSAWQALGDLAIVTNSIAFVDDNLQGHFIARDLLPAGEIVALDDVVLERNTMKAWDEIADYTKVSGNGHEAISGDADFAAQKFEVSSDLIPNTAFAQQLADSLLAFYSQQRQVEEVVVHVPDTRVYRPMDRVTIGPTRYMVYESDHDLPNDEATLKLVEDI